MNVYFLLTALLNMLVVFDIILSVPPFCTSFIIKLFNFSRFIPPSCLPMDAVGSFQHFYILRHHCSRIDHWRFLWVSFNNSLRTHADLLRCLKFYYFFFFFFIVLAIHFEMKQTTHKCSRAFKGGIKRVEEIAATSFGVEIDIHLRNREDFSNGLCKNIFSKIHLKKVYGLVLKKKNE